MSLPFNIPFNNNKDINQIYCKNSNWKILKSKKKKYYIKNHGQIRVNLMSNRKTLVK